LELGLLIAAVYILDLYVIALTRCGGRREAKGVLDQHDELPPLIIAAGDASEVVANGALTLIVRAAEDTLKRSAPLTCAWVFREKGLAIHRANVNGIPKAIPKP
jgi:hypothetical protein